MFKRFARWLLRNESTTAPEPPMVVHLALHPYTQGVQRRDYLAAWDQIGQLKEGQYLVHVYVVVEAPGIEAKHFGLMHSGRIDLLPNEPVASLNAAFNRRLFPITKAIADEQPI